MKLVDLALSSKGVNAMKVIPWFHYIQSNPLFQLYDFFTHCHIVVNRENIQFLNRAVKNNLKKPKEFTSLLSKQFDTRYYEMNQEELKEYNLAQIKEIKEFKKQLEKNWGAPCSEEEAVRLWSERYSASFRKHWHMKKLTDFF